MFAVFAAHAAPSALLMFTTGTAYGEAIGEYRGDPLYHASLDPAERRHRRRVGKDYERLPFTSEALI